MFLRGVVRLGLTELLLLPVIAAECVRWLGSRGAESSRPGGELIPHGIASSCITGTAVVTVRSGGISGIGQRLLVMALGRSDIPTATVATTASRSTTASEADSRTCEDHRASRAGRGLIAVLLVAIVVILVFIALTLVDSGIPIWDMHGDDVSWDILICPAGLRLLRLL